MRIETGDNFNQPRRSYTHTYSAEVQLTRELLFNVESSLIHTPITNPSFDLDGSLYLNQSPPFSSFLEVSFGTLRTIDDRG